jgi:hypothetical protein
MSVDLQLMSRVAHLGFIETKTSWVVKRANGIVSKKPLVGGWVVTLAHVWPLYKFEN